MWRYKWLRIKSCCWILCCKLNQIYLWYNKCSNTATDIILIQVLSTFITVYLHATVKHAIIVMDRGRLFKHTLNTVWTTLKLRKHLWDPVVCYMVANTWPRFTQHLHCLSDRFITLLRNLWRFCPLLLRRKSSKFSNCLKGFWVLFFIAFKFCCWGQGLKKRRQHQLLTSF